MSMITRGLIGASALGAIIYAYKNLTNHRKETSLWHLRNKEKPHDFYPTKLNAEKINSDKEILHKTKVSELTVGECFTQLTTYASWGNGTHINQIYRKRAQEQGHYRAPFTVLTNALFNDSKTTETLMKDKKTFEKGIELLETIDCKDAGLPNNDSTEIERCQSIQNKLLEIYLTFQTKMASDRFNHNTETIARLRNFYETKENNK